MQPGGRTASSPATSLPKRRFAARVVVLFVHVWTRRLLQALLDDGKWSARMYPACLEGSLRMPAASMRFAHLVLSRLAARLLSRHEKQDPEMLV